MIDVVSFVVVPGSFLINPILDKLAGVSISGGRCDQGAGAWTAFWETEHQVLPKVELVIKNLSLCRT